MHCNHLLQFIFEGSLNDGCYCYFVYCMLYTILLHCFMIRNSDYIMQCLREFDKKDTMKKLQFGIIVRKSDDHG